MMHGETPTIATIGNHLASSRAGAPIGLSLLAVLLVTLPACSSGPSTDSETHWMKACSDDEDCDDGLDCLCGVCTTGCDDDCSGVGPDAVCTDISEDCDDADAPICLATCDSADDCPGDFNCSDEICEPADGFNVSEPGNDNGGDNNGSDGDEPTLPALNFDIDCAPSEDYPFDWEHPCDWLEFTDAAVWGTLEDLELYESTDEGIPDEPLSECDETTAPGSGPLKLTIDVDDVLQGDPDDVGDTVEVFVRGHGGWTPRALCDEDEPSTVEWGISNYPDDGAGPLEIGQRIGVNYNEHDAGHLEHSDVVDPLFTNRDERVFAQPGAAFQCHLLGADDFDALSIDGFLDVARNCRAQADLACEYEEDFPCFGEDCCSEDCSPAEATVYDMEHMEQECVLGAATYACSEDGLTEPAEQWLCSMDGEYVVHASSSIHDAAGPGLTDCSNLAAYEDGGPQVENLPACQ